ncbi:hypothetical protein B0H13DRAFT_2334527 [Mycena leptocephala]|nr:hypothetical protein B0H13DRAFT_2334527 [Mycena leptocephala]
MPHEATRPLKRGRACLTCRFLKIKCDGQKPACGPCLKRPKEEQCEYSDGPTRSRTKALEETVARLEARLHDLEDSQDSTRTVKLHYPYLGPPPSHGSLNNLHELNDRLGPLHRFPEPPADASVQTDSEECNANANNAYPPATTYIFP